MTISYYQYSVLEVIIEAKIPSNIAKIMKSMHDIIKPAIAKPLGLLKTPIKDRIIPINHSIQPIIGTQQKTKPSNAKTKPAVPMPFDLEVIFWITIV